MPTERPTEPSMDDLRRVTSICRSLVPRSFDIEDLAVGILVESWSNHQPQPSYGFVRHRCIDAMRDQGRENEILSNQRPHDCEVSPDDKVSENESVTNMLAVLNVVEKRTVIYRFLMDYSVDDIARRTKVPTNSVRETLASAVYKMRDASW